MYCCDVGWTWTTVGPSYFLPNDYCGYSYVYSKSMEHYFVPLPFFAKKLILLLDIGSLLSVLKVVRYDFLDY